MCFSFFKRNKSSILTLPENEESIVCYVCTKKPINIDSRLVVPEGYSALLCYHNRICYELNSGNYILNNVTIPEIINLQNKWNANKNKSIKNFNMQVYFIKQGEHEAHICLKHKKYKFANKQKSYVQIDIATKYLFLEPKILIKNMIDEFGVFKTEKYQSNFESMIYDELNLYVLKNEIEKVGMQFSQEYIANMLCKFKKKYIKIGLDLLEIKVKNHYYENEAIASKGNFFEIESREQTNSDIQQVPNNIIKQSEFSNNKSEILQETNVAQTNAKHCPKCQSVLIEGAMFCHVCGCKID